MPPMGCNWSQRKGFGQEDQRRNGKKKQKKKLEADQQICQSGGGVGDPSMSGEPPSGAPPPSSSSHRRQSGSGGAGGHSSELKLGSLTETWKDKAEWNKYTAFLDTMSEGEDSDGRQMSLGRYARFLELYVRLDQAERVEARPEKEIRQLTLSIREHEEDFFGTERCLRCIDRGMRSQVLDNLKRVRKDEVKGGTWVYQPVYPRVVDKLNELLGTYNKTAAASVVANKKKIK